MFQGKPVTFKNVFWAQPNRIITTPAPRTWPRLPLIIIFSALHSHSILVIVWLSKWRRFATDPIGLVNRRTCYFQHTFLQVGCDWPSCPHRLLWANNGSAILLLIFGTIYLLMSYLPIVWTPSKRALRLSYLPLLNIEYQSLCPWFCISIETGTLSVFDLIEWFVHHVYSDDTGQLNNQTLSWWMSAGWQMVAKFQTLIVIEWNKSLVI